MSFRLPNLIVIGAMKSGTTSIHDYLNQHPDIYMSETKEIDFFIEEKNWNKGVKWYKNNFFSNSTICGESSQNYSKRHHFKPGVPKKIYELIPDTRIIYLVRDPIQRIVSHYHEALEGGYPPKEGLNQYLTKNPEDNHYILTSSYYYQISAYLEFFPKDKILIISLDSLRSHRLETMNKIFRFLNLSECNDNSLFDFTRNTSETKRSKNIVGNFLYGQSSSNFRKIFPRDLKDHIKSNKFTKYLTTNPIKREEITEDTFSLLAKYLQEDVDKFRRFTGYSFSDWIV